MRILYSHRIQSRDGQSVHLEAMVAALRAEGHEVWVVGPGLYHRAEFGGESRLVAIARGIILERLLLERNWLSEILGKGNPRADPRSIQEGSSGITTAADADL